MAQSEALPDTLPARVPEVATSGADAAPPSGGDDATMSLVDHLSELRWRLFVIIVAVSVFSLVAFTRAERLLEILKEPLGDRPLNFTGLGDGFVIQLKLAIVVGLVASMPVILFEVWRFISPGLTPRSGGPRDRGCPSRCSSSSSGSGLPTSSCPTRPATC